MGLWDFVKNAGKALGIGEAEAAEPPAPEALKKEVEDLGLKTEGLKVTVDGDTVKLSGKAASQAEREKVILAVGNVAGVAKVEEAIETPEPAAEPVFHTVVKGDTLWKISEKDARQRRPLQRDLRGEPPDAQGSRQDLPGPGAAHPGEVADQTGQRRSPWPRLLPIPKRRSTSSTGASRTAGRSCGRAA